MKIKTNTLFYLVALFILLNVMDIITTLFILPGESNPIYHLTKSIWIMMLFKIGIMFVISFIFYKNRYTANRTYFLFIAILLYGSIALLIAQIINIYAILHPAVLAVAAAAPTSEKVSSYYWFMNIIYFMPLIFSYVCFIIYDKTITDIQIRKREKWYQW